jgi:hypothetical protein
MHHPLTGACLNRKTRLAAIRFVMQTHRNGMRTNPTFPTHRAATFAFHKNGGAQIQARLIKPCGAFYLPLKMRRFPSRRLYRSTLVKLLRLAIDLPAGEINAKSVIKTGCDFCH